MKDRFSGNASGYSAFRPTYPKELFDFILSHVEGKQSAWDCGTGNGQVARDLAPHFKEVHATDISVEQIKKAREASNIFYSVSAAEATSFPAHSFDLITVAQAIHWFNIPEFYKEVKRTGKPGALIAVWGYGLLGIDPPIDKLILDFYKNVVGPYWDAERRLIDESYATIAFPFEEIKAPEFEFTFEWTIDELQGYLTTWSSVQKFIIKNQINPVESLMEGLAPIWGNDRRVVRFPLFLRIGKVFPAAGIH